jgi:hypothetical protein
VPKPKFLTKEMAQRAIASVFDIVFETPSSGLTPKRKQAHVVILVPFKRESPSDPYVMPKVLYEASYGNPDDFAYPFQKIAQSKASQLWHSQNDERTDIQPHLLFSGDSPFWGGVARHGIVVTCSGIQPWLDRMIAGMIADMLIAMAYQAWMDSEDKADDELCFLT